MVVVVVIGSGYDLRIRARCRNQPRKTKLLLYKPLLHFYSHLKQLYISKTREHFSYKDGCGVRRHH